MPEGLIFGKVHEGKRAFGHVSNLAGNTRNTSVSFFCLDIGTRPLFMFFHFSNFWITVSPKLFKQILVDLFLVTKRSNKQICQVSLKYIDRNGFGNDLKIASFLGFFKMSLFEIHRAFLARDHGCNLNFALNEIFTSTL